MPGERIQHIITLLSYKLDILPQVRYLLRTFITLHLNHPVRDFVELLSKRRLGLFLKVILKLLLYNQKISKGKLKQFRRSLTLLTFNLKEVYKDIFKSQN